MKAILLAATILLSLAGQNPSQDKQAATNDQGVQSLQSTPPAQQPTPPTQGQQPPTPAQDSEGPNLVIEEVIFEGNNVFSSAELSRQLRRVSADVFLRAFGRRNVFTRERFQEDAARLMRYMTDRGYLNASVGEPKIRFINIADAARDHGRCSRPADHSHHRRPSAQARQIDRARRHRAHARTGARAVPHQRGRSDQRQPDGGRAGSACAIFMAGWVTCSSPRRSISNPRRPSTMKW